MRMWMVNPEFLCRKHLLGEHGELHKHRHNFVKQHSVTKRIELGQIEPASMEKRHNELVAEMLKRGYNHNSPYEQPDIGYLPIDQQNFVVDQEQSLKQLLERCCECRLRYLAKKSSDCDYKISKAVPEDIPYICEIIQQMTPDKPHNYKNAVEKFKSSKQS